MADQSFSMISLVDFTPGGPYNDRMKKLSQQEIDDLIGGKGLIEIEASDLLESERILEFLKKKGAYIATSEGTFKVTQEIVGLLKESGFKFSEVGKKGEK